jgi:serine/threonine protein kinase
MRMLRNENIVQLIEVMETKDHFYIIMEYCNQGSMDEYLKQRGQTSFSEQEAKVYLHQLLNAFKCLHHNQILHRDFKQENIFIKDGIAKIGDFGFSKISLDNQLNVSYLGSFIINQSLFYNLLFTLYYIFYKFLYYFL